MSQPLTPALDARPARTALICGALLIVFYLLALSAVRTKSPTMDEPLHALGSYLHVFERDYRVNPEDPPLWNYLAMVPQLASRLQPNSARELWDKQLQDMNYWFMLTTEWLFHTPGQDGLAFINRSRAAMLLIGVALGACLAAWGWQLGGATTAVVACFLFCFDPNFLGHAPLIKNDLGFSLCLFCLAWACWSLGKEARVWNIALVVLACAVGGAVKFSGVLLGPIMALLLMTRALRPAPWIFLGRQLRTRAARVAAAIGVCVVSAVCSVVLIWACYGFRFDPTPLPGRMLNMPAQIEGLKRDAHYARTGEWAAPEQAASLPIPLPVRIALFAERHRLLPQAWLFGFVFTYRSTLFRETFLLGQYGNSGWWYYFPLAMLFKTPVATLLAVLGSALLFSRAAATRWSALCIAIPFACYALSALTSHLNLGLRHVLALYPLMYLMIGLAAVKLRALRPRAFLPVVILFALGLVIETLVSWPHYIAFFNAPSRPYRLKLLSDSNFDWGQDLTDVAHWQQRNPDTTLYLGYFGSTDPQVYGIRYINIPGGFVLNPDYEWPPQRGGVIAISATLLQGVNCPPSCRVFYARLRELPPREILGDTIYLFDTGDAQAR
jgi:hypothetical protein